MEEDQEIAEMLALTGKVLFFQIHIICAVDGEQ